MSSQLQAQRRPPRPSCGGRSWSAAWTWRRPWAVWRRPSRGEAGRAASRAAGSPPAGQVLLGCWRPSRETLGCVVCGGGAGKRAGAAPLGLSVLPGEPPSAPTPASKGSGPWAGSLELPWTLAGPGQSCTSLPPQSHSSSRSSPDPQAPLASSALGHDQAHLLTVGNCIPRPSREPQAPGHASTEEHFARVPAEGSRQGGAPAARRWAQEG